MLVYLFKVIMDILYAFHIEQRFPINMHITFATNRFNNFHQREYDFSEYEKKLLNQ